jgi:pimeloyl-ACP methyl ester carboxylesterase
MECMHEQGTIYYETYGDGRPMLVLHGGYLDHRHMVSAIEPLFEQRAGWKRIYPDLPGHGRSGVADSVSSHDQVLEIIQHFMHEICPNRSYVVAGESRGGYLARGLVHKNPELVDGALFIVPGRYAAAQADSLPTHATLVKDETLLSELNPHEARRLERIVVQSRKTLEKIRRYKIPAVELADNEFQAKVMESYEFSFNVDKPSEPFTKPTLILLGRQDTVVGYRDAWKMVEIFPRATFAIIDMAGHSLSWEQEDLFNCLVSEWIQRVEGYVGD